MIFTPLSLVGEFGIAERTKVIEEVMFVHGYTFSFFCLGSCLLVPIFRLQNLAILR
jgi:hypothetical protein